MNLSTIIFIVGLPGAFLGVRKPLIGGIAGLLISPLLFYTYISPDLTAMIIVTLACFLLGLASGFAGSILMSGLKGKGHKAGTTYLSGFGVHHPGGIILSSGERKVLRHNKIYREIVISY